MKVNKGTSNIFIHIIFIFGLSACSSIQKDIYYTFEDTKTSRIADYVYDSSVTEKRIGFELKSKRFKKPGEWFGRKKSRRIYIEVFGKGTKYYMGGPILLPIIPVAIIPGDKSYYPIPPDKNLKIRYHVFSDREFGGVSEVPKTISIQLINGNIIKPIKEEKCMEFCKYFTFDIKLNGLTEFILNESMVKFKDGNHIKVPNLKFKLIEETNLYLSKPIAP